MSTALNREKRRLAADDQQLYRMLALSVVVHLVFFAVVVAVQGIKARQEPLVPLQQSIQVDLVMSDPGPAGGKVSSKPSPKDDLEEPAVKAPKDPVETPEQPDPAPLKAPKEAPREDASIKDALKPAPAPEPGLDEEARSALAERVARQKMKDRIARLSSSSSSPVAIGDGTPGGRGTPGANAGSDPAWVSALTSRIQGVWLTLPSWMNKDIRADVHVTVDAEGNLRKVEVVNPSGDVSFDNAAIRAVKKAAPLPLPTKEDLRAAILTEGVTLGFNPKGLSK